MKTNLINRQSGNVWMTALLVLVISAVSQAQVTTHGTDFWLGFAQNFNGDPNVQEKVYISGTGIATSGVISVPQKSWSQNFTVTANGTTIITLPTASVQTTTAETIEGNGVHIISTDPVSVSAVTSDIVRTEASHIFATPALGSSYYVMSYPGFWGAYGSAALIVSTQNNTIVDIIPSVATSGNKAAGVKFSVTLNAGEVYQIRAKATGGDLSGTKITASNSNPCARIAVFGATGDAYVPVGCGGTADPLYEEMPSVDKWGKEYVVPPLYSVNGSIVRIMASQANTSVVIDGGAPVTLNAGIYNEQSFNSQPHCIVSDKPVMVVQYLKSNLCTGTGAPNAGDPDMIVLGAVDQVIKSASFRPLQQTAGGNQMNNTQRVNVVMKTSFISQLKLDGTAVNASLFSTAGSCSAYSYATLAVSSNANHTLTSDSGYYAYLYGYGNGDESYAYSLGWSWKKIPLTVTNSPDSVICSNVPINFSGNGDPSVSTWQWSFGDGATGGGQNVSHTFSSPGSYTVKLVTQGGCDNDSVTKIIQVISFYTDPQVTVNSASVCQGVCANLTATGTSGTLPYTYSWSPAAGNGAGPHIVCPVSTTTYTVTITDNGGKTVTATSVVTVNSAPVLSLIKTDAGCTSNNGTATVTVTNGTGTYSYSWAPIGGSSSAATGLSPGTYSVTVNGTSGCSTVSTITVGQITLGVSITSSDASCKSQNGTAAVVVSGGSGSYTYLWTPSVTTGFAASSLAPGTYDVSVNDGAGCVKTETVIIKEKKCDVIIPNVFTPAGDGINDKFIIDGIEEYPGSRIQIFNRWGTLVYESSNYQNEWDGRAMKSLNRLNEGVYYYILHLSGADSQNGFITLVRGYRF